MSNKEIIEDKISYVKERLKLAETYKKYKLEEVENNHTIRSAIERELYLIAQSVIDLAEAVIAFKGFRKPTSLRESIDILGEEKILPTSFAHEFARLAGFRNALAHDYKDLKVEVIYKVLQENLGEVNEFIGYIKDALRL